MPFVKQFFNVKKFIDLIVKKNYNKNMLEIKNLSYSVEENSRRKDILKDINLTFEDNKLYVITGHNGSGKSSLLKLVMGIMQKSSGQIILDGQDISNLSITQRAQKGICYAFQQPVTFKGLKVKDLLDIAAGQSHNLAQMCDILSKVGLCAKDYIDRFLDDKLSGGELKRIELAQSLAREGKINMFDEPEAGIDLWSFENLTSLFDNLKKGITIVVSHQKRILEIADEIILLSDGRVIGQGSGKKMLPLLDDKSCGRLRRD